MQKQYRVEPPEWVSILKIAKAWAIPPWEVDPSRPNRLYWVVRQERLTQLETQLG